MRGVVIAGMLFMSPLADLPAMEVTGLYRAETIVTGTAEAERRRGFRLCLSEVIVKLTGNAEWLSAEAASPLLARAHELVVGFEYEDRMKGIPVHDEQGTRERPHFLRVVFDRTELDRALQERGLRLWSADRPLVAVWLGVRTPAGEYVVREEGDRGYAQRSVLVETAARRGIPVALPGRDPAAGRIAYADIAADTPDVLAVASPGAEAILAGTLILTPSGYWDNRWVLWWRGESRAWTRRGVTFDSAIRDGLQRSARLLSGAAAAGPGPD